MSTWVMGTEQLASLLLSAELPDLDQFQDPLWSEAVVPPDEQRGGPTAKRFRAEGSLAWQEDGALLPDDGNQSKLDTYKRQPPLSDLQMPQAVLSREQLLEKQKALQRQQEMLQLQQQQLQAELLKQDLLTDSSFRLEGQIDLPSSGRDSNEKEYASSVRQSDLILQWSGVQAQSSSKPPESFLWENSLEAAHIAIDCCEPVLQEIQTEGQRSVLEKRGRVSRNEGSEEAMVPIMPGADQFIDCRNPKQHAPALDQSQELRGDARKDSFLDCLTDPCSGGGALDWNVDGESTGDWLRNFPELEDNPQASGTYSSASGSALGGPGSGATSCDSKFPSVSFAFEGSDAPENLSPLATSVLNLQPAEAFVVPCVSTSAANLQKCDSDLAGYSEALVTVFRPQRKAGVKEDVQAIIQGLQAKKSQQLGREKNSREVGSLMAERLAAIVRKRKGHPVGPSGPHLLEGPAERPMDEDLPAGRQLAAFQRGSESLHSGKQFVVSPEFTESIRKPIFSSTKEAILKSLGVDGTSDGRTWLLPEDSDESSPMVVANRQSVPPLMLRNTVLALAEAIATDDQERANLLAAFLKEEADPQGSPIQRISHQFLKALMARKDNCAVGEYVKPIFFPVKKAQVMVQVWSFVNKIPCLCFWMEGIVGAVLEAVEGHEKIHVIDFGMWGGQWPAFIRQLAVRPGGPPKLVRFTAVISPVGTPKGLGPKIPTELFQEQIVKAAEGLSVALEFEVVTSTLEDLRPSMLNIREGEAVAVNCALRLAQLMDSSVIRWSPRDAVLQVLRGLNPCVVVMAEMNVDFNGPFFLSRVKQAFENYSLLFDAHEGIADRGDIGRLQFEDHVIGKEILNLVACEGLNRYVRHEPPSKWQARMWQAGFVARTVSDDLVTFLRKERQSSGSAYDVYREKDETTTLTYKGFRFGHLLVWQPFLRALPLK